MLVEQQMFEYMQMQLSTIWLVVVMMFGKAIVMEMEEDVHIGVQKNQQENLRSLLMILCITKTIAPHFLLV